MPSFDEDRVLQLVEWREGCPEDLVETSTLPAEPASFTIRREGAGRLAVITLHGELDLATAPQLAAVVDSFSPGETITVDLCQLDFMDCSGVRELVRAAAVLGEGLHVVCGRHGPIRRLFGLAGVEQVLRLYSSRAEALRAASRDEGGRRTWPSPRRTQTRVEAARPERRRKV